MAYKLLLLPVEQINAPITSVALPTLSRLQTEPEKFKRYYYQAILIIAALGMPMTGFLFASANIVIPLALGSQWVGVVPIFQWLMPAAHVGICGVAMGWAFISLGKVREQLQWGIFSSGLTVLIFIISVRWGALGVAIGYGCSSPFLLMMGLAFCYRDTFLRLSELVQVLTKPFLASMGAIGGVMAINQWLWTGINPLLGVIFNGLLYAALYLGLWIVQPNGMSVLREIVKTIYALKSA